MDAIRKETDSLSIIVIEDNEGDYVLVEDYLYEKFKSINIHHYPDFKSVATYLQSKDWVCDLILLDFHLPDLKGIELVKNILALSPKIPVIILTGYADLPLAKQSLELGIDDFLVKDEINPNLLHKSVEFAISRSNYVRQIENQNMKLKNIAWTQSHVVRAPLAKLLGIINLIETFNEDYKDLPFWLTQLKIASNEMDEIVRNIIQEAQIFDLNK